MTTPLTKILHSPQRFVDAVGMYRIVTITLLVLLGASVLGAVFGEIAYSVSDQLVAVVPTIVIALGLNVLFSKLKNVSANHESALITALIVFFLAAPQPTLIDNWAMYAAVAAAIFSKFFIVYRKQHIVNPAAAGLLLVAFGIWKQT